MLGFVFCHGWGYDASFWDNLKPYFDGYPCIFWDLGYFGDSKMPLPELPSSTQWVGVGHSLGFLKLLNTPFPWHKLIGLQGFLNFQGNDPSLNRRRSRDLLKLKNQFGGDATTTLSQFHGLCGAKDMQDLYPKVNRLNLLSDFSLLEAVHSFREIPSLILCSDDDLIVTTELINDNFGQHNQVQIITHNKGLHNLGFSEPSFVKDAIFNFLSNA